MTQPARLNRRARVDTSWHNQAACRGEDPDLFFDPDDGMEDPDTRQLRVQAAKQICYHCPVIGDCWQQGLTEKYGIWGGDTEQQRARIRRSRAARRTTPTAA